jgi:tRNA A37 threonylcarbamoyladenosine modification protein TsaB
MYLLIDMSKRDLIHLALFDENFFVEENYEGQNRELLECIEKFIKSKVYKVKSVNDIKGIIVVVGAGSFTSTRIATVVANSFGFTLQIPLLAIQENEIDNVLGLITKLLKQPKGQYISATYSGEPNITKPKK